WLPGSLTLDRAGYLRAMNRIVATSKLPTEKLLDEFERIDVSADPTFALLVPALQKVVNAHVRNQAKLRCLLAALAAERYRREQGTWPASLHALVQAGYLKAVPLDPYDGQPLRYKWLADGVLFYSIGPDRTDNGGVIDLQNPIRPGTDMGIRLWNAEARG